MRRSHSSDRLSRAIEKYGFGPSKPPRGTEEYLVTSLMEPTGREDSHPGSARSGIGDPVEGKVDGHSIDKFGRFVPTKSREEVLSLRRDRKCPAWPYCEDRPVKAFFACMKHWYMIPPAIRSRIWVHSRRVPNMEKLRPSVKEAVWWLHYALGPSITPEKIANRVSALLAQRPPGSETDPTSEDIREAVTKACEDAEAVSHAKYAEETWARCWEERLECVWY